MPLKATRDCRICPEFASSVACPAAGVVGMSDSTPPPNRNDRIARDADIISGFFGTRAGTITTVVLIGGVVVFGLVSWVLSW